MKTYEVILSPEAEAQLEELRVYIAEHATPRVANGYIDRVVDQCRTLSFFPHRGTSREEVRPGMRSITLERSMTIGYSVEGGIVTILAFAYRGRDLGRLLT